MGVSMRRLAVLSGLAVAAMLSAPASAAVYTPYFGDLHNHTSFSDGWEGTPLDAFLHADASGADWLATSDHNFMLTQDEWSRTKAMADQAMTSSFVAMAASEYWVTSGYGEVIVLNNDELRNKANFHPPREALSRHEVIGAFLDWLDAHAGAIGHWPHPGTYGDLDRLDGWSPAGDRVMSSIEVYNHGSFSQPAGAQTRDTEPWYVLALDKGWHVMPAAVSDTHSPDWISGSPARTVLLATSLGRASLYAALRNNRGYATIDENLRVSYTLNGAVMGSSLLPGTTGFTARIAASDPDGTSDRITSIEIVSDGGAVVASKAFSSPSVSWTVDLSSDRSRYYYVRITTASDPSGQPGTTAWTAPVWTGR